MSGSLDHQPADVVRWLLIGLGVGTDPDDEDDWPIYAVNEPDLPDDSITAYSTEGQSDGRLHRGGETQEHYGVQLMVRGADDRKAWVVVNAVIQAMEENASNSIVDVGESQYVVHAATRRSGPIPLGREPASNRFLFSLNYIVSLGQLS